jgi:hypothetical protein
VQWWPDGNKTKALRKSWPDFAKLLEEGNGKEVGPGFQTTIIRDGRDKGQGRNVNQKTNQKS